jgi:hypothetical protein
MVKFSTAGESGLLIIGIIHCTEGDKVKIGNADRTPRETLEKRLEKCQVTLVVSHKARPWCVDQS